MGLCLPLAALYSGGVTGTQAGAEGRALLNSPEPGIYSNDIGFLQAVGIRDLIPQLPSSESIMLITLGLGLVFFAGWAWYGRRRLGRLQGELKRISGDLDLAVEVLKFGVWEFDPRRGRLDWDENMYRLHGLESADSIGDIAAWQAKVHPDDQEHFQGKMERALRDGKPLDIEYRVRDQDTGTHYIQAHAHVVHDAYGQVLAMRGLSLDTSSRKRLQGRLGESEGRFHTLFNQMTDAVFIQDLDGRLLEVNDEVYHRLGYGKRELLGKTLGSIGAAEAAGWDLPRVREPQAGGKTLLRTVQVSKDGLEIPTEISLQPTRLHGQQAVLAIARDISQHLATEQALQEREARLRTLVETIPDLVWLKDPQGAYLSCNQKFERFCGAKEADIAGKTDFDFVDAELAALFREKDRVAAAAGGPTISEEWITYADDGHREPVEAIRTPVYDEEERLIGVLGIARDITERKRAQAELERRVAERTAELQGANQELESFTYAVSHDLRAPLRAITGFSEALREDFGDQLEGEAHAYLQHLINGSERMRQLVEGLLQLSRSTGGGLERQDVNLSTLADGILVELIEQEPDRRVESSIEPDLWVRADPRLMRAVLQNLLGNAWKFTAHAARPQIHLCSRIKEGLPWYCVEDNGAGFDMAYADKLFSPFQRLHGQAEFPGTGIGLATVQRIIHRHGGRIRAEATVGQGAIFCFSLDQGRVSERGESLDPAGGEQSPG